MRFNSKSTTVLHTPALPTRHAVWSGCLAKSIGRTVRQARLTLDELERSGVVGADEKSELMKSLLDTAKQIAEINQREKRAVAHGLQEDFGGEIEKGILAELKIDPDRIRYVPNATLRRRLRETSYDVVDFVDTMVESLKRLRYSRFISEKDYVKYRRVVELLPALRADVLDLMEKAGG